MGHEFDEILFTSEVEQALREYQRVRSVTYGREGAEITASRPRARRAHRVGVEGMLSLGGPMRALWVLAASGCTTGEGADDDCDVPTTAAELAGPDATACGTVALGDPLADAWACAVAAFEAGTPAWLAWEDSGIDSIQVEASVFDGARVWLLHQDQYQDGPWRIDGSECVDPYVGEAEDDPYDGRDDAALAQVLCTSWEPEGNHYQVCGECPGCNPQGLPFPG